MKRLGLIVAVGAVLIGLAVPAAAQAPNFTVTFGGQFRVFGLVWDNMTDFSDTDSNSALCIPATIDSARPRCKDSDAYYFQRFRLFTTVESADKNAKIVWGVEIGDITWGAGGGASGDEFGQNVGARTAPSGGGALGSDGVNVETKTLYLQFNIPFIPNANLLLGAHNIVFMTSPAGNFMDDDGWGIQFNWKADPIDLQAYTVKIDEGNRQDADDNTMYVARLGVNITPDIRFTVEGMVVDAQCYARRSGAANPANAGGTAFGAGQGSCVSADFGDNFWIGGTVGAKVASMNLHGSFVYGQRQLWSQILQSSIEESGYGVQFTARVPFGPVSTWWHAWYISGDESRIAGGCAECVRTHPLATQPLPGGGAIPPGVDFSTNNNSYNLIEDSDKLPLPITGASWSSVPYVAEFIKGLASVGAPGFGSTHYSDSTGTWGIGGSASYSLTPALSVGGGIGFISAVEDGGVCTSISPAGVFAVRCGGGVYGDHAIEFDGGVVWRFNPNLTISGLFGYVVPDEGDDAWGALFRTQFSF
jgi:hypothetical protein